MRILFTRFPLQSAHGGAEIQTISLMKGLLERGHAVAFAGSCPVLLEMCKKEGIPAAKILIGKPPVTKWGVISFTWRKQGMKKILMRLLNNFSDGGIDVICMLSITEKLLLTADAAKNGTKVMWIEHDRIGRWLTQNPWLPLLRQQSTRAITVPVSHMSGEIYKELGWDPSRIHPIANGISQARFTSEIRNPKSEIHRLLCIARLSPEKGIDVLIESMAGVPDTVTLEIIGTGPEEHRLHALTHQLDLADRIIFTPKETDIAAAYRRSDALVLPSRDNDPFGLVAAEAMLCGLPVIVTDECGIAGYVENGKDAIIAEADSISALSQAINKLPSMGYELGVNGQKTAKEKFSVERMVKEYEDLFYS